MRENSRTKKTDTRRLYDRNDCCSVGDRIPAKMCHVSAWSSASYAGYEILQPSRDWRITTNVVITHLSQFRSRCLNAAPKSILAFSGTDPQFAEFELARHLDKSVEGSRSLGRMCIGPVPGPPLNVWTALVPSAWVIGVVPFFLFEVITLWRWAIQCCRNSPGGFGVNFGSQEQRMV